MKVVHKYVLSEHLMLNIPVPTAIVPMPNSAKVRHAAFQGPNLCVWAERNAEEETLFDRRFYIFPTGYKFPDAAAKLFIATVFVGNLVFHIYEDDIYRG